MDVKVEIKNGAYDFLTSGVLIVNGSEPTTIKLIVDNEELSIIIKFVNSDKDEKKSKKVARAINDTTLEVTFTNYNSYAGNYTKKFWNIASIKNRRLHWGYTIYGFREGSIKKIDYSFYLGEGVANG